MKVFQRIGKVVNTIGGSAVSMGVNATGNLVSTKLPKTGEYIKDVGNTVVNSSKAVIANTAQFADGAVQTSYGAVRKDPVHLTEGWNNIKTSTLKTGKGIGGGLKFAGESIGQSVIGIRNQDSEQIIGGLKNVGKVVVVGTLGISVIDMISGPDLVQAEEIITLNSNLDGTSHSITGVPFESKEIELNNGTVYAGVFPVFDSEFDAVLPEDTYLMSDEVHIGIANMQLHEAILENPQLGDSLGFNEEDVENLKSTVTPEGYDWHHTETPGQMQLVDETTHGQTAHTGGRFVWGGGSNFR